MALCMSERGIQNCCDQEHVMLSKRKDEVKHCMADAEGGGAAGGKGQSSVCSPAGLRMTERRSCL